MIFTPEAAACLASLSSAAFFSAAISLARFFTAATEASSSLARTVSPTVVAVFWISSVVVSRVLLRLSATDWLTALSISERTLLRETEEPWEPEPRDRRAPLSAFACGLEIPEDSLEELRSWSVTGTALVMSGRLVSTASELILVAEEPEALVIVTAPTVTAPSTATTAVATPILRAERRRGSAKGWSSPASAACESTASPSMPASPSSGGSSTTTERRRNSNGAKPRRCLCLLTELLVAGITTLSMRVPVQY
ncbi:MAG: hypothetical protein LKI24_04735 [Acidipropionibacterium sp.]|nr:hypothetical protein [Acidipropionibacterium sp.]